MSRTQPQLLYSSPMLVGDETLFEFDPDGVDNPHLVGA